MLLVFDAPSQHHREHGDVPNDALLGGQLVDEAFHRKNIGSVAGGAQHGSGHGHMQQLEIDPYDRLSYDVLNEGREMSGFPREIASLTERSDSDAL